MNVADIIGFIITALAMVYLFARGIKKEREHKPLPPPTAPAPAHTPPKKQKLKKAPAKKAPVVHENTYTFKTADLQTISADYIVTGQHTHTRISKLFQDVPSKKDIILFTEILSPPKALRENDKFL